MPLTRKLTWDTSDLHNFLVSRATTPFAWGTNDCCLFPADAILAMTGVDIATDFRGKYSTQLGATKILLTVTGASDVASAAAHCATQHGLVEYAKPLMAKRGDLVVLNNGNDLIAGIVHLNGRDIVSVSATGLVRLPIMAATRAWKV